MNGACNGIFCPAPWGPEEGPKGHIPLNFNYKVNFFNQTLCVYLRMKDIKHIRRDFHTVAWVMPQWWDLGYRVGWGSKKLFSKIQPDLLCELLT